MTDKEIVGTNLLNIRTQKGETQEQVADSIGISYVSLCRYETGQRMPKMNILAKLADHFGVSVDELMGRESSEEEKENAPRTPETIIVSANMDDLPQKDREVILSVFLAMMRKNYPERFEKGDINET